MDAIAINKLCTVGAIKKVSYRTVFLMYLQERCKVPRKKGRRTSSGKNDATRCCFHISAKKDAS